MFNIFLLFIEDYFFTLKKENKTKTHKQILFCLMYILFLGNKNLISEYKDQAVDILFYI